MESECSIELKDFDTIFVTGHVTTPFAISWSKDDKIALIVDEGVQIFEFHPTPLSDQLTISLRRSWIPANTDLPFRNVIVDNKANSFVWKMRKKEVYDMAIDSTLCTIVEKTTVSSFITECVFSPLIYNECYICCLTNNGVLEIYKWDIRKWKPVVNVSNLWIERCKLRDNGDAINYNVLKERMFQMKILTMMWLEKPQPLFVTGHEDGGICIWNVEFLNNLYTMNVHHYFHISGKPSCLGLCHIESQQTNILIVGTLSGTVKCIVFKLKNEMELEKQGDELDLWKHEDFIKPSLIRSEDVGSNKFIFTIKNHIVLIQKLKMNEDCVVSVVKSEWHEFLTPIVSFSKYQNIFILGTRNHEFFSLRINENDYEVKKNIDMPLKPKHTSCFHCYGLALSRNEAIWIVVSSAKVNYDPKSMKDANHLLIFTPKQKTFRSLTDTSYSNLIGKIAEMYGSTSLTEISDLLEMKKCELLADPSKFGNDASIDSNTSPLKLKLLIWESKLRIYTQSAEVHNVIAQCEELLTFRWCSKRRKQHLEGETKITDLQKRSLEIMEILMNHVKSEPATGEECAVCGAVAPMVNIKVSSCPNSHVFPRCSLSLLPCDAIPYGFCRLCNSTVLLEFISDNDYRCLFCDGLLVPDTRVMT